MKSIFNSKKLHKHFFLVILLSFLTHYIQAQEFNLFGIVIDSKNNQPLEGATITVINGNFSTNTNTVGEFTLLASGNLPISIKVSYIGYVTAEFEIKSKEFITIKLNEQVNDLEEVLVLSGYTEQKKKDYFGAVSNLSTKQIMTRPAVSFDQLLGGLATGVDIIQPTNILNNTPVMRIRGINTITSGLFPLVVVDGVALFTGSIGGIIGNNPLADINPSDIQSIDILKDASSAAIYGSRAANGVMVITTKKGKKGRIKVNYDNWASVSTPYNLPELLNAEDYVMIKNEAMSNSGKAPGYVLIKNPDGSIVNTNWYDVAYEPGISHGHNLSFSGANNSTSYYFSLGYTKQNNFIKYNSFERFSSRLNIDNQLNNFIKVGANIAFSNGINLGPNTGAIPSNTLSSSSYNSQYITNEPLARMTFVLPPNVPVYNADGSYSIQNGNSVGYGLNNTSTIGTINAYNLAWVQKNDVNSSENNSLLSNVFAELKILDNLKFKTSYGINNLMNENISFMNPIHGGGASSNGVATNINARYHRKDWINTLSFNTQLFDNQNFSALLGHEVIQTSFNSWGAQRSNITDPYYTNYQGGFINIAPIGNVLSENALLSYFSNLTYDFNKKYFASLNFRRDGLSALADGNKFGNFWGGSLGWNVFNEEFYAKNGLKNIVGNLKIRTSYGIVGNSEIGDYPSIAAYTSSTYGGSPTLTFAQAGNPDLKWETSKKFDAGFNFSILNEKISFEFDYYKNVIDGLILKAPQALSAGIPGNFINANVGSMYNEGIELGINYSAIRKKDLLLNLNINISTLTNKVTSLVSDVYVPSIFGVQNMTRVGYSVGSIFAVEAVGVNPENGLMVFKNREGKEVQYNHIGSPRWTYLDGTAAPAIDNYKDGKMQGPSLPKLFGGINSNLTYKNFELNLNLTFVAGNKLYNGTRATNSDQRYFNNGTFIKDRWTTPGQQTEIAKLQYGDNVSSGFSFSSTSKVEKGDYLKLKNILIAYNIPMTSEMVQGKISSLRIYVQAVNLYTLTEYRGSDPEVSINGNSIHSGKDQNVPPNAQVYSVGLNVGF